ncbi:MAG: hypothetical protein J5J06_12790 [Phycisphaerae bacterium]|nr:hypothetical protein [Phycisphaerae bacterium]
MKVLSHPWYKKTFVLVLAAGLLADPVTGQTRPRPRRARSGQVSHAQSGGLVTISYPDEVDLTSFVDYVSQTTGVKIVYENELNNQTLVFRPSELEIPKDRLLELLRGMLRMRDLALVDGELDGWLRIVATQEAQRHTGDIRAADGKPESASSNQIVTQVIHTRSRELQRISQHARSFLSSKASVIEVPDKSLMIVTDYQSAIARALEVIELLDRAPVETQLVTVRLAHASAADIQNRVVQLLGEKAKLEERDQPQIVVQTTLDGTGILLLGKEDNIAEAQKLIEQFDVPLEDGRPTVAYSPRFMSADRLQTLVENALLDGSAGKEGTRLFLDQSTNRLYVTGPQALHRRLKEFLEKEDVRTPEAARPMRIYRPRNRLARELIALLSEVLPNVTVSSLEEDTKALPSADVSKPPGPNRPPKEPGQVDLPVPPAQTPREEPAETKRRIKRVTGEDFVLTFDEHTNAIIAIGPLEFHDKLQRLLGELDKRQPQVLIEMTLVAITFNDSFSLAVEVANEEKPGDFQSLLFSSFGLSDIDLTTGKRSFKPGGGFNGVVLGPHETPILVRAIAAHGNSRIMATPKIVLSDNTTATVGSVEEAPFTSINASDTVATTSFAGFESAGTTLTVTPHITQGDHLVLDYSFNFSNFTGSGSVGVPPPRTTNTFSGTIAIPDSHTVVVGGLVTENETDSVTEVPLLGRIPVVGALFQSSDRIRTKSRIYAFIRPTVLRDDRFADLKFLSRGELRKAEVEDNDYPPSEYLWMR